MKIGGGAVKCRADECMYTCVSRIHKHRAREMAREGKLYYKWVPLHTPHSSLHNSPGVSRYPPSVTDTHGCGGTNMGTIPASITK